MSAPFQVLRPAPDRLLISAPASSLVSPWLTLALVLVGFAICYPASRTMRRVLAPSKTSAQLSSMMMRFWLLGVGGLVAFLVFFWLISYSSGSIVLDRATNMATVHAKMTAFLPAQSRSAPLNHVERARLDYKVNARRIRLLVKQGSDLAFPVWSDRRGQQEAVVAINEFLGKDANPE